MKILIPFFWVLVVSFVGWSQDYPIYSEQNCTDVDLSSIDISGGIHETTTNVDQIDIAFYLKNNSGSTKSIKIARKDWCINSAWQNNLIVEPACTDPNFTGMHYSDGVINNSWQSIAVTIQNDSMCRIVSELTFNGVNDNGVYRYYFYDSNTLVDSVDLKINGGCYLNNPEFEQTSFSVFPNPVNTELFVSMSGVTGNHSLRLADVFGKIVYENAATDFQTIPTESLKNGVYLITILENETVLQTRRVVVKH